MVFAYPYPESLMTHVIQLVRGGQAHARAMMNHHTPHISEGSRGGYGTVYSPSAIVTGTARDISRVRVVELDPKAVAFPSCNLTISKVIPTTAWQTVRKRLPHKRLIKSSLHKWLNYMGVSEANRSFLVEMGVWDYVVLTCGTMPRDPTTRNPNPGARTPIFSSHQFN